jgi:hypothetical protein
MCRKRGASRFSARRDGETPPGPCGPPSLRLSGRRLTGLGQPFALLQRPRQIKTAPLARKGSGQNPLGQRRAAFSRWPAKSPGQEHSSARVRQPLERPAAGLRIFTSGTCLGRQGLPHPPTSRPSAIDRGSAAYYRSLPACRIVGYSDAYPKSRQERWFLWASPPNSRLPPARALLTVVR